ncbi:hypothetical protein [Lactococcus ileimucosae]|uniref:Uncharacterized protein n=1 Tax=Lactococcus ileimucosae TaxID=2941329 RepID=A0ABV4D2Q8_9LACT
MKRINLKKIVSIIAGALLMVSVVIPAVGKAGTRTTSCYKGSALMWSNDHVTFSYNGKSVTSSYAYQNGGAIFPLTMSLEGIKMVSKTTTQRSYQGRYSGGGGIPTPWGNANLISQTKTMQTWVRSNGSWTANWVG